MVWRNIDEKHLENRSTSYTNGSIWWLWRTWNSSTWINFLINDFSLVLLCVVYFSMKSLTQSSMIALHWTSWWPTHVVAFHVQPRLYFLVTNEEYNSSCGLYTVHLDDRCNLLLTMCNQGCISWWSIKIVANHRQRRMRPLVRNEGWSLTSTINTMHLDVRRKQQIPMRNEGCIPWWSMKIAADHCQPKLRSLVINKDCCSPLKSNLVNADD